MTVLPKLRATSWWPRLVPWLTGLLTLIVFGAATPALIRFRDYVQLALAYASPLDPQEGFALWETDRWRAGLGFYVPIERYSFVSAPYPPVHPFLLRLIGSANGPHVFWGGRMLALAALVAIAAGAMWLVRRVSGSWLGGVAAIGLVLAQPTFQLWSMRIKPDLVGLAATVVGLALVAQACCPSEDHDMPQRSPGWLQSALWALLFVVAHFTKQTLVAGPLAAATLLWLRDHRAALRFGVTFVVLLVLPWLALDLLTHGQYTYHIWFLHQLGWKVSLWLKLVRLLAPLWPLMLLSLVGLVATWRTPTIINAYILWAPLSLLGAGVQGANHNHLLETGLALALAGGQALGFGLRSVLTTLVVRRHAALLLALPLLALQWLLLATPGTWFRGEFTPDPRYGRYINFIRATAGEILADDVGLLYAAGRPLRYDDPSTMGPAAARGLWDESGLLDDLRNHRFSAVILPVNTNTDGLIDPSGHWTPAALQTLATYYRVKFPDTRTIYVPK
ncbi:MAG: hypothetical protein H0X37_00570 [Herpetosiphonaceae bacterium]|nr:hypothetical protein [Herpetosiphonaceae bacterium]